MELKIGKFYMSRDKYVWCCFQIDMGQETLAQARCIRIEDERLDYFYLDGRYDSKGERSHTLVREIPLDKLIAPTGSTITFVND